MRHHRAAPAHTPAPPAGRGAAPTGPAAPRGQALLEFALTAAAFLFLVFGLLAVGLAALALSAAEAAAIAGAEAAATAWARTLPSDATPAEARGAATAAGLQASQATLGRYGALLADHHVRVEADDRRTADPRGSVRSSVTVVVAVEPFDLPFLPPLRLERRAHRQVSDLFVQHQE